MATPTTMTYNRPLDTLPSEILLHILSYLDIPELHVLTLTSRNLRSLATDPLLHSARLHRASLTLSHSLSARPSLAELMRDRIYVTRTTLAARNLSRNLTMIKLNRKLSRRPSVETLVELGVLPSECYGKHGARTAPGLIEIKRRVEKERIKDVLRRWIGEWRGKRMEELEKENNVYAKPNVKRLARRFARDGSGREVKGQKYGRYAREKREDPTRAKVLGLRNFWEKIGKEGGSSGGHV